LSRHGSLFVARPTLLSLADEMIARGSVVAGLVGVAYF
jgi:hypothetical protein